MARSKSVITLIKDLEPDELREVIRELCKLSSKNRQFLQLFLQSSDAADPEPVVEEAKKKIRSSFYGGGRFPKLDLRAARRLVSEYGKVLKEYPRHAAELRLYYVEVGTEVTNEFGDLYEGFYSSLVSMFESFCNDLKKHPGWYGEFQDRIERLRSHTEWIGWGYGDDVGWLIDDLREHVESSHDAT